MPTRFSFPTRVVWGAGSIGKLAEEVRLAGGLKVLVVTDRGVIDAGIIDHVRRMLEEAQLAHSVFSEIHSNPIESDVWRGVAAFRELDADVIVGIGGGAPIDTARAIRLAVHHPQPLSRYDDAADGGRFVTGELPPLIAIPTTAGTGSEISRSAVVLLDDTKRKTVLFSPRLMSTCAIVDPELTTGLPAKPTAWTGMDAFTHCLEAYVSLGDHPLADALAIEGIRLASRALPAVMKNGGDLSSRTEMMSAAMMGGIALTKGLGAAHAIAHAVGAVADVHHGLTNAVVLPAVCRFNEAQAHPRFARVAEAMGEDRKGRSDRELADRACTRIESLCREVGIPPKLSDVGVVPNMIPAIVEKAVEDASHRTNPRPFTADDCERIVRSLV
ncbi:iron-containing alcohol dehydrogenase [Vulgatibacter incomptus]|uniref:Alcohol dehydrogenase n=1 Tax=Vulgatibacter incomptus TaxID=1391653 RepID=A0A0K1PEP6_9BACT|nr:iron-containing alcohol dehydrogenase [Vulgatibacter incomptus]AKU91886.1 Alcohol dehydrogenase [Vulgatibacter incomptus]